MIIARAIPLLPLFLVIAYHDVRYRRIPNPYVLAVLVMGVVLNTSLAGSAGLLASVEGCLLGFGLMFILHVLGAMGAGDVKLFAAVSSVLGIHLVLPAFVIVVFTGGLLAVIVMLRFGTVRTTMMRVFSIMLGLLPGWRMPHYEVPADRSLTIPYGVAISLGSLVSLFVFRA
jgi:prepilin peptidase CpaA